MSTSKYVENSEELELKMQKLESMFKLTTTSKVSSSKYIKDFAKQVYKTIGIDSFNSLTIYNGKMHYFTSIIKTKIGVENCYKFEIFFEDDEFMCPILYDYPNYLVAFLSSNKNVFYDLNSLNKWTKISKADPSTNIILDDSYSVIIDKELSMLMSLIIKEDDNYYFILPMKEYSKICSDYWGCLSCHITHINSDKTKNSFDLFPIENETFGHVIKNKIKEQVNKFIKKMFV